MATVRHARPEDVVELTSLMYEYIVDFYGRPKPPEERVHALIHMCLEGYQGAQFVAEENDKLVGFATLYVTYSTLRAQKAIIMNDLYIQEAVRGTGVAEALFNACRAYTEANGFAFMSWETARDNYRAQRFYEKMGAERGDWLTYSV